MFLSICIRALRGYKHLYPQPISNAKISANMYPQDFSRATPNTEQARKYPSTNNIRIIEILVNIEKIF